MFEQCVSKEGEERVEKPEQRDREKGCCTTQATVQGTLSSALCMFYTYESIKQEMYKITMPSFQYHVYHVRGKAYIQYNI